MKVQLKEDEYWWGGAAHHGRFMPIGAEDTYGIDLSSVSASNQSVPFFLSTAGRYIWHEEPFSVKFEKGFIVLDDGIEVSQSYGNTLKSAYEEAMSKHFPFNGKTPEKEFFSKPQYNTWAELTYGQNQQSVLKYAHEVVSNGYKPGIIMIDDTWQLDYGMWQFDCSRFPNPKEMVDELHTLGFKVMLWVAPYISPDSPAFRDAARNPKRLLRDKAGNPVIAVWWNGYSAVLNMKSEDDCKWMKNQLDGLIECIGIDGFKFDGGNLEDFVAVIDDVSLRIEIGRSWHRFGAENYPFHELKDTWKCGGYPYVQRLRDKHHCWGKNGIGDLIPDALNVSLTGHPFICPDMVGGGEWTCFVDGAKLDEELIVRFAQCSALFPMIQFSVAPWRVLNTENQKYVLKAQQLHNELGEEIYRLAQESAKTGEPMMRALDYVFPSNGYETVTDEFLLGDSILCAPVLEKGANGRFVVFPSGIWQDENGKAFEGPDKKWVEAPLGYLPWYRKK